MNIELAANGNFLLDTGRRTRLEIPVSAAGARALYDILHARQMASAPPKPGEPGFPTQAILDIWIREETKKRKAEAEREHAAKLADFDLIIDI